MRLIRESRPIGMTNECKCVCVWHAATVFLFEIKLKFSILRARAGTHRSIEGEKLKQFHHSLKLENNGRLFMIFPLTVCHVIDSQSPLYDLSAKDLLEKK